MNDVTNDNKAVFIDRDGVINPLVYNVITGEYESPHHPEDFSVYPYVIDALKLLVNKQYKLILISNQPAYAKGMAALSNIQTIMQLCESYMVNNGITINKYNYCLHHPKGVISHLTTECNCRKPGTLFLEQALEEFNLNKNLCYFIGDQDIDIQCGINFGIKTIKINNKHSIKKSGNATPYAYALNLMDAAIKIIDN